MAGSSSGRNKASLGCRGCDLWENATQTVFGEGPAPAALMLVGEQPGDREDRDGSPFVGPAGRLLNEALEAAGLNRDEVYVSNVGQALQADPAGEAPNPPETQRRGDHGMRPLAAGGAGPVQPKVLVCLGATAAQALLGRTFGGLDLVGNLRGRLLEVLLDQFDLLQDLCLGQLHLLADQLFRVVRDPLSISIRSGSSKPRAPFSAAVAPPDSAALAVFERELAIGGWFPLREVRIASLAAFLRAPVLPRGTSRSGTEPMVH